MKLLIKTSLAAGLTLAIAIVASGAAVLDLLRKR